MFQFVTSSSTVVTQNLRPFLSECKNCKAVIICQGRVIKIFATLANVGHTKKRKFTAALKWGDKNQTSYEFIRSARNNQQKCRGLKSDPCLHTNI